MTPAKLLVCAEFTVEEKPRNFGNKVQLLKKKPVTKLLISLLSPEIPLHKKCRDADPNAKALC